MGRVKHGRKSSGKGLIDRLRDEVEVEALRLERGHQFEHAKRLREETRYYLNYCRRNRCTEKDYKWIRRAVHDIIELYTSII